MFGRALYLLFDVLCLVDSFLAVQPNCNADCFENALDF